ncbi:hypothetical protein HW273_03760 [Oribacterium sp. oral taxon 102]|uniref:hypothetical protein n=1 Tax=Oribacterium sp. oral taxon 102 TaxID=671214 RepID=UPI0015BD40F5|nr:hypothetical protein [Oribacterium sp. oral taxon 102]NWO21018.1 hypothetical protein [Oribacterium sp. oral taxon 102]
MHPNTSFLKYFPEAKLPEVSEKADRSICLRIRAFIMIRKIITGYHLDEIIGRLIGKNTSLFLDLAAYSIVTENNAGQYYPDYAYTHLLFTQGMKLYSGSKISSLLMVLQEISVLLFKMNGTAAIITVKRSISLMIRPIRITGQVILSASRSDIRRITTGNRS